MLVETVEGGAMPFRQPRRRLPGGFVGKVGADDPQLAPGSLLDDDLDAWPVASRLKLDG